MKKTFLIIILFLLVSVPVLAAFDIANPKPLPTAPCPPDGDPNATGLVPCGQTCSCTIINFFVMLGKIYNFLVLMIATPLAILALTISGIMILISAGNPNLLGSGKKIFYAAVIGLVLVFCSWLIINTILSIIGYQGNWFNPF